MLEIKNLSKIINGRTILHDISLNVPQGHIAFLLGASGVGKSTLLRILNNLDPFNSGKIFLDGKPLDLSLVNRTHTVGMVFQHFNLFDNMTVKGNITLPLEKILGKSKKEAEHSAKELLAHYGLQGLENKPVSSLSGGKKQRLAIARTVALKPKIICFDEPTSALDPMLTGFVASTIDHLAKEGYIILVASHDTMLLEQLPCTIYLMQGGTIAESVTSQDFSADKKQAPRIEAFISGAEYK